VANGEVVIDADGTLKASEQFGSNINPVNHKVIH
jgi:hypothetical protein